MKSRAQLCARQAPKNLHHQNLPFIIFWIWLEHMCGFRAHPRTHPHGAPPDTTVEDACSVCLQFRQELKHHDQTSSKHEKVALWVKVAISFFQGVAGNRLVCTMKIARSCAFCLKKFEIQNWFLSFFKYDADACAISARHHDAPVYFLSKIIILIYLSLFQINIRKSKFYCTRTKKYVFGSFHDK